MAVNGLALLLKRRIRWARQRVVLFLLVNYNASNDVFDEKPTFE